MTPRHVIALVAVMVLGAASAASAQSSGSERPYRGLFGGGGQPIGGRQTLSLSLSAAEAFDQNVLGDVVGVIDAAAAGRRGTFTSLTATLTYGWQRKAVQFSAIGGSTGQYYPGARETMAASYYGNAALSMQLPWQTQVAFTQSVSRTPSYLSRLFGALTPAAPDATVPGVSVAGPDGAFDYTRGQNRGFTSFSTGASVSRGLTRRGTVAISGGMRNSDFNNESTLKAYNVRGQFGYVLTRNMTLRMGYGYRNGTPGYSTSRTTSRDIDLGIDYNRALSFSRRTTLGFKFGSALLRTPLRDQVGETWRLQYQLVGDAWLNHQIGRTWTARGQYLRGILFVEGLPDPVLSNAFTASLAGQISRRVDVAAALGYTKGASAQIRGANGFDTYTGGVRTRFALSRAWASYVEYSYFAYDFSRDPQLLSAVLARRLERSVVRVGLSLWVPLLGR